MNLDRASREINQIRVDLKKAIMKEINRQGLDRHQLAEKLDLLPSGVEILFSHSYWPIEKGLSIIKALDLDIKLGVEKRI